MTTESIRGGGAAPARTAEQLDARAALANARVTARWAVEVRELRVRLGGAPVLRGIALEVAAAERVAICGPNGAGKTTLLRVLAGLIRPSSGDVRIAGLDPRRAGAAARAGIGVLGHQTYLFGELTVAENLRLFARLYGVARVQTRCAELLDLLGLGERRDVRVDELSRGQQQRLAIGRAWLHDPPVLLLDEPETGLDLPSQRLLEALLRDGERTVLLATHSLEQVRRLCQRAVVLVDGRLVADLPVAALDAERLVALYGGGPPSD